MDRQAEILFTQTALSGFDYYFALVLEPQWNRELLTLGLFALVGIENYFRID